MQYSISDLEKLSGISVHNIRIWERRYSALQPSRTAGNTRFYDDEQLKRLLGITGLYHSGYKISHACSLSNEDIALLLEKDIDQTRPADQRYEYFISQIVKNTLGYSEKGINALITTSFNQNGILDSYKFVIYPLLVRIGLMWLNGRLCPSQEHFLSQIIRQKLFVAIDKCGLTQDINAKRWLLFLPEDEHHDIPLLLSNYLLRAAGAQVYYLGPHVPLSTLSNAVKSVSANSLLFFMTRTKPATDAQNYLNLLSTQFPDKQVYLSGNKKLLDTLSLPQNINMLESLADFEHIIKNSITL